jgi:hypothetical protein
MNASLGVVSSGCSLCADFSLAHDEAHARNGYRIGVTHDLRTCPTCGSTAPAEARFCASCGSRLNDDADEDARADPLSPSQMEPATVAYMRAERRLFGVVPTVLTCGVACLLLALAVVLLTARNWIVGVAMLVCSGALFVVFFNAAKRDPSSAPARAALAANSRLRGWLGFVGESAGAWSEAGRNSVRLRRELRALRAKRSQAQFALGDAAYRSEDAEVAALRARLQELNDAIADREQAAVETLERARRRIARERLAIQPTQQLPPEDDVVVRERAEASDHSETSSGAAAATAKSAKKSDRKKREPGGPDGIPHD